jgi:hypothetical protein
MVKKQRFSMWFLQWVSLANTVLPTEIIICRFADEWGGVPPPHTPPVAPPLSVPLITDANVTPDGLEIIVTVLFKFLISNLNSKRVKYLHGNSN